MARRTVRFTPGDRPEMLWTAATSGADVIVFDLEDAVSPPRKDDARESVRELLADPGFDPDCEICMRVNASPAAIESDLDTIVPPSGELSLDSVMRPKAGRPTAIRHPDDELATRVTVPILALIESARGVLAADEIAAVPVTDALVFGAEDLAADIGASRTDEGTERCFARQRVVVAAAAHDCDAIDTLVADFEDEDRLRADTERSLQFGFNGKLAIHPAQVGPSNETSTPRRGGDRVGTLGARSQESRHRRATWCVRGRWGDDRRATDRAGRTDWGPRSGPVSGSGPGPGRRSRPVVQDARTATERSRMFVINIETVR